MAADPEDTGLHFEADLAVADEAEVEMSVTKYGNNQVV